jgi:hypothetical protein
MDRKEQRKIFNKLKKGKEDEIKLRTIEQYGGEVYQMYLDGEITLQNAYNHSKSEQLGVDGYKSKGTKGFITSSKIQPLSVIDEKEILSNYINHCRNRSYMGGIERDKLRVKKTAEVFTPTPLVQQMLDELPDESFTDPEKKFLDPSCGDGQFLSEVVIRKMEQSGCSLEQSLSTTYGVELMEDNVKLCKERLAGPNPTKRIWDILDKNIVCDDALKYDFSFGEDEPKSIDTMLPYQKHPFVDDETFNITYHEINQMDYTEFRDYILKYRKELKKVWNEKGIPPYIGKNYKGIVEDLDGLNNKDVSKLYRVSHDTNYEFIIENNWREGSTCNQFFPSLHKVRVGDSSMWDLLSIDELELRWLRMMVRNLKQDYLYEFSKRFKDKIEIGEKSKDFGLVIHKSDIENELTFTSTELKKLQKNGILQDYHFKNIEFDLEKYKFFEIRYYKKEQKIFNNLIHILRVSFGNTPVNFHPQVSKFIYEHFLPKGRKSVVYDPCSGFGGRLLGSLLSQRKIHYIGTDINTNLFEPENSYSILGDFVKENIRKDISYHIDRVSSDEMNKSKELKKYMGKVDMVFTSPPYFGKEQYSDDENQSYRKYPNYKDWVTKYLHDTFDIVYKSLKKGGICLVNISDITINTQSFPLELDTISTLENIGFTYQYQIGMKMQKFMGLNTTNILNRWWDKDSESFKKVEPILVFKK